MQFLPDRLDLCCPFCHGQMIVAWFGPSELKPIPSVGCKTCGWELHNIETVEQFQRGLHEWQAQRVEGNSDYEAKVEAITWSE